MSIGSPEEEAVRQQWLNEDVAFEDAQIERDMIERIDSPVIFARDLDGTGSLHICGEEDAGAVRYIRERECADMMLETALMNRR